MTARQLPLLIPADPAYDEASFLPAACNEAARAFLGRTELWPDRRLAVWGEAGHGKTHLLRIWTARTGAALVEGPALSGFPDIASVHGVAVDDADRAEEAALLHLLNTARDLGRPVLLAGRAPPARWTVGLRDLASRLRAITAVEVGPPDDALLRGLLLRWLADRRLVAEDPAMHERLLTHLPRSPDAILAAVARLDHDALSSRRRTVTPAMLRAALLAQSAHETGAPETGAHEIQGRESGAHETLGRKHGAHETPSGHDNPETDDSSVHALSPLTERSR